MQGLDAVTGVFQLEMDAGLGKTVEAERTHTEQGLKGCGVGYVVFLETVCVMEGEAVALPGCTSCHTHLRP